MHFESVKSLLAAIRECRACLFSNPKIAPLAPREVRVPVAIMFIGENPSWAENQNEPFAPETISGKALQDHYLSPLNLSPQQVWITDLMKCRYPAKTRWAGYPLDIYRAKARNEAKIREVAFKCATLWLAEEIRLARPKVIVTLSDAQVYQRFRNAFALHVPARFENAVGIPHYIDIQGFKTILFPMVHPDVGRPVDDDGRKIHVRRKWAPLHREIHIPNLKQVVGT